MVTKKLRTEYMKKFKDPKWETYSKCYEDLVKYRLSRKMLEQSHNPFFWGGWETDSESSGRSTPQNKNKVSPLSTKEETLPKETLEQEEEESKDASEPTAPAPEPEPEADAPPADENVGGDSLNRDRGEGSHAHGSESAQNGCAAIKPHRLRKPKQVRARKERQQTTETDGVDRHPFALYGWAEQRADMAGKKTHNVRPAASTKEIHASALRAKTRREVEKQMKTLDRRRVRSADLEKIQKTKPVPDYNPWMSEYMRCFSTRSR
ncbi:hypothetical protein AGOR_G00117670 [Albula goreensis]|uniref:Centriole, cilia and spindle-associated protein n=1 Tax=Albula goreensis TaxID=1534307 RepID=A0A8T3DBG7_9TELE|nr:hypothetical protein AGOR_G00117670 [Albula goreensis]